MINTGQIERHAVRILFILFFCRDEEGQFKQLGMFNEYPTESFLESETKLQKFDFWIRYPDHLAAALLNESVKEGFPKEDINHIQQVVRQILYDEEPIIRHIPMRRYLRGAHEPLDDVISFLSSRNLAYKRITEKGHRTRYYITEKGLKAVQGILQNCTEAEWYADRCRLLNRYFGKLTGNSIRSIQYLEEQYETTPIRQNIERIVEEVERRFEELFQEPL